MSNVTHVLIKPPGKVLVDYYQDRTRNSFICGPLGSSKTFTTIQKILKLMCEQEPNKKGIRPSRWFAIRNTFPDLENTTIRDWLELWGDLGTFKNGHPPQHTLKFNLPDGTTVHSEIIFMALDRPDAIKKLRGTQATGFWMNETKELSKSVLDMADLRHGRYPTLAAGGVKCTWHGIVGDTNAPDEDHWYYTLAEETDTPGWEFHRQPGGLFKSPNGYKANLEADNIKNLPDNYYTQGQVGKSKEWINVNLCNEYGFVSDGKPVYPEYEDSVHCLKKVPEVVKGLRGGSHTIVVGIDFGLTPAAVFGQQLANGQWVILSEVVTFDMGAVKFAKLLNQHMQTEYPGALFDVWGDPAGEQRSQADEKTPFKMLRAAGIPAKPTYTNDPIIRREAVAVPLQTMVMGGSPALVISPKCKMLRKAMAGGYKYRRMQVVGEERYTDKPDKGRYSHVGDAVQYFAIGAGLGRALVKPAIDTSQFKVNKTIRAKRRRY